MKTKEKFVGFALCLLIVVFAAFLIWGMVATVIFVCDIQYHGYGYGYVENDKSRTGLVNKNGQFFYVDISDHFYPEKDIMDPLNSDDTWIDKSYYKDVVIVTEEQKIKSKNKVKYYFNDDDFETNSYISALIHSLKSNNDYEIINYTDAQVIPEKCCTKKVLIRCGYWSSDKEGAKKCEEDFVPPYILESTLIETGRISFGVILISCISTLLLGLIYYFIFRN